MTASKWKVRYCPACEDEALSRPDKTCVWCDGPTRPRGRGQSRINKADLRKLHLLHVEGGMSIRQLGIATRERFGYSKPVYCEQAIRRGWQRLGLIYRDRAEANRVSGAARRMEGSPGKQDRAAYDKWWNENRRAATSAEGIG